MARWKITPPAILRKMQSIYNGNSNKSGVYQIVNKLNNRIYIGSAFEFKSRFKQHLSSLRKGKHHNKFLQRDFDKCGSDAFVFEVLEVVEGEQANRLIVEQKHIDYHYDKQGSCYNLKKETTVTAMSSFSKTPEETRKLISKNLKRFWSDPKQKERCSEWSKALWADPKYRQKKIEEAKSRVASSETRQKMREAKLGKKASLETRQKLSKLHKGSKMPPRTEEWKKKMSESRLGKKIHSEESRRKMSESKKGKAAIKPLRPVSQFSLSGEFIKNYESVTLAARELNIHDSNIHKACNGSIRQTGGFVWKYGEPQCEKK